MGAIEKIRLQDRQRLRKEKERLDDWDINEREDWASAGFGGHGKGHSTLSKRLGQVRAGDWGITGGKKKASSLRNERLH